MLTELGFKRKRYDDFVLEMENKAKELFGNDVNLSERGPFGKFIKLIAYARAEENELSEKVYLSAFYDTAEGSSLDYVCKYIGITRIQSETATGQAQFSVETGTTVNAGMKIATTDGIEFKTLSSVTDSDNDGIVVADIEALETGPSGNVPANTITEINTPQVGVNSVTNPSETSGGREQETDKELRDRYALSVARGGSSTLDSIRAKLLETKGVRASVVIENTTDSTDSDGRPPHSFESIVLGGNADDVGKSILESKPGGIQAYGTQSVVVKDASDNDQTIGFSYATQIDTYINVTLTTNASFPTNGQDMVKLELIKYIGGQDQDGNIYAGIGMGEDVVHSKLVSSAFRIAGVEDAVVETSTDGTNYASSNIAIEKTEVAETDNAKVVITIV